jgi:CHAT domain-containing protein
MNLNADLVVLSACQTALGKDIRGEGLIGLTRGFMHAGAGRVLATLWNVEDRSTSILMQRFYEGLLGPEKLSPAAALRKAQQSLLREDARRSPHFWAGFTVQGDWH